jgi:hypothetical protein
VLGCVSIIILVQWIVNCIIFCDTKDFLYYLLQLYLFFFRMLVASKRVLSKEKNRTTEDDDDAVDVLEQAVGVLVGLMAGKTSKQQSSPAFFQAANSKREKSLEDFLIFRG